MPHLVISVWVWKTGTELKLSYSVQGFAGISKWELLQMICMN